MLFISLLFISTGAVRGNLQFILDFLLSYEILTKVQYVQNEDM